MFVSRKIVYPFFLVVFSLVLFSIIFLVFLNNSLLVSDSSVSVNGSNIVLKLSIENNSNHAVNEVFVLVRNENESKTYFLKETKNNSFLDPKERFDFIKAIPLEESLEYFVEVGAPFNKSILLNFKLDESTIDPVKAEVFLPKKLLKGNKYLYSIKFCNISNNDLSNIFWIPLSSLGDFEETFYEQSLSIKKNSCDTIYGNLTPNRVGELNLSFLMKIGSIEKRNSIVISVVDGIDGIGESDYSGKEN